MGAPGRTRTCDQVSQAVTEIRGRVVVGTPKTHQSRWIPIPKLLLEGLENQVVGKAPEDLVFQSPRGCHLGGNNFRRGYFDRAAESMVMQGPSPHASCGTRAPSQSPPVPRSRQLSACSVTHPPRSLWAATDTCSRTSWTDWLLAWTTRCANLMWSRCAPGTLRRRRCWVARRRKPPLTCRDDGRPRQDSNLRPTD
jgi:hypothetical protein